MRRLYFKFLPLFVGTMMVAALMTSEMTIAEGRAVQNESSEVTHYTAQAESRQS